MRLIGLVLALSLTLAPRAATAQQPGKAPRIGMLLSGTLVDPDPRVAALRQARRTPSRSGTVGGATLPGVREDRGSPSGLDRRAWPLGPRGAHRSRAGSRTRGRGFPRSAGSPDLRPFYSPRRARRARHVRRLGGGAGRGHLAATTERAASRGRGARGADRSGRHGARRGSSPADRVADGSPVNERQTRVSYRINFHEAHKGRTSPQLKSLRRVDSPEPGLQPPDCGWHRRACHATAVDRSQSRSAQRENGHDAEGETRQRERRPGA